MTRAKQRKKQTSETSDTTWRHSHPTIILFFLLAVRHHTKASVKSVDLYLNLLYIDPVRPAHSGKTCLQRTKTWR